MALNYSCIRYISCYNLFQLLMSCFDLKWYHKLFFGREIKELEKIFSDFLFSLSKIHAGDFSNEPFLIFDFIPVDEYIECLESCLTDNYYRIQTIESYNFFQTIKEGLKGGS